MRKLFFIGLIVLLLGSCSVDNTSDVNNYFTDYVPIATVEMPETFELGQTYMIAYTYYRPTTCHLFRDILYEGSQNQSTIYVTNTVLTGGGSSCAPLTNEVINRTFDFAVTNSETHYFKFWQGLDDSGQDLFLEFEVSVN